MTFVNELNVPVYDVNGHLVKVVDRTIDRARGVTLAHCGNPDLFIRPAPQGDGEPVMQGFRLTGPNFNIMLEVAMSSKPAPNGEEDLFRTVERIRGFIGVEGREPEILSLIVEAVTAYGIHFGANRAVRTFVTFSAAASKLFGVERRTRQKQHV